MIIHSQHHAGFFIFATSPSSKAISSYYTSNSTTHVNSLISAGSFTSESEELTLSGANLTAGTVDITTDTLLVESLQDTSTSSSESKGGNLGLSSNGMPSSYGANASEDNANSAWVNNQTGIIGGNVNIKAKDTTITGAVIAAVDDVHGCTNAAGAGCTGAAENGNDNGQLNIETDTLTVNDIFDNDESTSKGVNVSTGSSSTSVGANYSGHDKEQTTKATLGNGTVIVGGKDISEHEALADVNRDINNSQEITKDQERGGLDANVTVDHRLLSEEGRQDIANDLTDTVEHGQDIARTVDTIVESDNLGILNFGEALHNNASATQLKNDLVRNPENKKILDGLQSADPEVYAKAVADLGKLAQEKFGLDPSDIGLYDADKTASASLADNPLIDVKGATVVDPSNQHAGDIFIDTSDNVSKTDMMNTLGHEVLETQDFQDKDSSLTGGLFGSNNDEQQEDLANAFGSQFSNRINQAAGGNLDDTGGDQFNDNLRNSNAVAKGTTKANQVGSANVEHRQLNLNESLKLDAARKAIISGTGTDAEKATQLDNLNALACAEVNCTAGVSKNDPNYQALADLQAKGETLRKESGVDIRDMLQDMGVSPDEVVTYGRGNLNKKDTLFEYDTVDAINDGIDANEKTIAKTGGAVQAAVGTAGVVSGTIITATGAAACAPTAGGGCAVAAGGAALTGLSAAETKEGVEKLFGEHEYESGQRVKDSFSPETHQGEHNPALDLVEDTAVSAAIIAGSKVGLNKVDDLVEAVKEKLPSGNNGTASGDEELADVASDLGKQPNADTSRNNTANLDRQPDANDSEFIGQPFIQVQRPENIGGVEIKAVSPDVANGTYPKPAYNPSAPIYDFKADGSTSYVRVFSEGQNSLSGAWLLRAEDIEGLSPAQIQQQFDLPTVPTSLVDIVPPKDVKIRTGTVNASNFGGTGGRVQFQILDNEIDTKWFTNPRRLGQ